jgi:hypothetical protein
MIFDLKTGKRRRVIQVVFGFLAFIFFISFVGFGIGSDVSGGIFDAIGLGGNDSSSNSGFEQQIEDAEEKLDTDPEDRRALIDLVNYRLLSATESEDGVSLDPASGVATINEASRSDLAAALDAWERYLATDPKPVSADAAIDVVQINDLLFRAALGTGDASAALTAAEDAAAAGEIAAADRNTVNDYATLANYLYIAGKVEAGDAAAEQALKISEPSNRAQFEKALEGYAKSGAALHKELQKRIKQGEAEGAIEDPFGTLGGGGAAPPPATSP